MKYLLFSRYLEAFALPLILKREGHECKVFVEDESCREQLSGIVDFVDDFYTHLDWADCIIFDDCGHGALQDWLRDKGYKVYGGTELGDKLEDDRQFASEVFTRIGLNVPPSHRFTDFAKAQELVRSNPMRYCIKPNAALDKQFTIVGKFDNGKDIDAQLESLKTDWPKKFPVDFQLQEYVGGIGEIGIGAFFNGQDWLRGPNGKVVCEIDSEHKELFNDGKGGGTGEMGNIMVMMDEPPMFTQTLGKLTQFLKKVKYIGFIGLNFILGKDGKLWVLESTSRMGYPALWESDTLHETPWGEFFLKSVYGKNKFLKYKSGVCIAVVVMSPPYNFPTGENTFTGAMVMTEKEMTTDQLLALPNFYWAQVKKEDDRLVTCGQEGYTVVVTALGKTIDEARDTVYERIKLVEFRGKGFRTDIGLKTKDIMKAMRKFGYI